MVWECGHSRAPVRQLVSAGRLQSRAGGSGVAVSGVGAVLLYRGHGSGRARAGHRVLLCQSAVELPAAEGERAAVDGAAGRHAAGHQSLPLLLQPPGDSGAHADRVDAGSLEPGCPAAPVAPPGVGLGLDRPAFYPDDAHQDHRRFSPSGAGGGGPGPPPRLRPPVWASAWIGLLFTLMMLPKTTAVFLLPALGWAMLLPLWQNRRLLLRCALAAAGAFAVTFGLWMALVVAFGLLPDYKYLFFVNKYIKPPEFYWPLVSLWWSFHGGLWVDHILIPLAGLVVVGAAVAGTVLSRHNAWGRGLLLDPVFGASVWAVAGYILFMTYQNHPQPRYFAVVAFFSFFVVAMGAQALLEKGWPMRFYGWAVVVLAALAVIINTAE